MTNRSIQSLRRLIAVTEALVIIGLPFLKINGESALRFDISSLRLHFFGISLWMEEFYIVLIAIIFISLLFIFITILLGRLWCGWVCPQTVLSDLTGFIDHSKSPINILIIALFSILVSANLIWYLISPYKFFHSLLRGEVGRITWTFWTVFSLIIFLNLLLVRYRFCATVCPYARLQGTLFDDRTLIITFDERRRRECMECMACVKTCPVGVDIRRGPQTECTACARCIDACNERVSRRGMPSLINYSFGMPGEGRRIIRQNILLIGTVTTLFFFYLLYLLITRPLVGMEVLPNPSFQVGWDAGVGMVNSFILSIKNRDRRERTLLLRAEGLDGDIVMRPEGRLTIKAQEIRRLPVYIRLMEEGKEEVRVRLLLSSPKGDTEIKRDIRVRMR